MINCPNCDIKFSPSYATCPRCKSFETPARDREKYLKRNAADRISEGEDPEFVRDGLIQNGFSDAEADSIVRDATGDLRSDTRSGGLRRLAAGVAMLLFAGLIFLVVSSGNRIRGGVVVIVFFAMLGFGLLATFSGLYTLVTGRESKVAGRMADGLKRR
ncbi:hypothetical protein NZK35_32890 [Stieleria sp. ICT_E10.1]|uniref:hypothetical protein n=1 Tax=Stieleria sedimenti TaxID=2976331 RepID=UPI0021801F11|nr:hypothetical protein [Stieleria sedimenti]MCS7471470.1 hypothetical protein [Stieleria sedimenti]